MIKHYLKMIWKRRGKNAFLVAELILSFLVVFGVLAFAMKQFQKLKIPEGFITENIYNIYPSLNVDDLDSLEFKTKREQFKREILALEDIRNATFATEVTPYGNSNWSTGNGDGDENGFKYNTDYILCDQDFTDVWNTPIKEGNFFKEEDLVGKYVPIAVNQLFVDKFLKDTTALGFAFEMNGNDVIISGIFDHFKYQGKFGDETPMALVPISTRWNNVGLLTVATHANANEEIVKKMYDITARITKNFDFWIEKVEVVRKKKNKAAWIPIIGLFSLAGFLLINISMGLFGILRYNISRRKPEIGLRKAMGAHAGHIRSQFVGEMVILTSLAIIIGLIIAIQAPLLDVLQMENLIYWKAIFLTLVIIYGIVIACSIIPSSQAAAIEPAVSLHEE
ncbi:ABC transporter permease [Membranihabitans maritimus]|uniref:ABC transporter permease n=1 Tax=Membranihabitans maritimus TaxID=2904244 RepID=UPI001F0222C0|nr:FtsX-like permease family protein [Membranihabitans maritimus]